MAQQGLESVSWATTLTVAPVLLWPQVSRSRLIHLWIRWAGNGEATPGSIQQGSKLQRRWERPYPRKTPWLGAVSTSIMWKGKGSRQRPYLAHLQPGDVGQLGGQLAGLGQVWGSAPHSFCCSPVPPMLSFHSKYFPGLECLLKPLGDWLQYKPGPREMDYKSKSPWNYPAFETSIAEASDTDYTLQAG